MQKTYGWLTGGFFPYSYSDRGGDEAPFLNQVQNHWIRY